MLFSYSGGHGFRILVGHINNRPRKRFELPAGLQCNSSPRISTAKASTVHFALRGLPAHSSAWSQSSNPPLMLNCLALHACSEASTSTGD